MNKLFLFLSGIMMANFCQGQKKPLTIPISFKIVCIGEDNILNKKFKNSFGETYTITKLKFYVSHVKFITSSKITADKKVYLIDASKRNNFSIKAVSQKVTGISFLLGVDSLLNCNGAQTGALDPLNDMFWTWNNGYIFFKLEGTSNTSTADLQRIEHHIGGYKGVEKAMREIYLPINNSALVKNKKLVIQVDIDKYWDGINQLSIAALPVIALPGLLAKKAADNFSGMFSLKEMNQ